MSTSSLKERRWKICLSVSHAHAPRAIITNATGTSKEASVSVGVITFRSLPLRRLLYAWWLQPSWLLLQQSTRMEGNARTAVIVSTPTNLCTITGFAMLLLAHVHARNGNQNSSVFPCSLTRWSLLHNSCATAETPSSQFSQTRNRLHATQQSWLQACYRTDAIC